MIPMDWIFGLVGGLVIGGAAALYLLVNGRVMGASGILGGIVDATGPSWEKAFFVAGLLVAPVVYGVAFDFPATHLTSDPVLLILAGLLVGIGTRMANGCTSGHGVCGISRFSIRGIVATMSYLGAGFVAMYIGRHILGAW